MNNETTASQPKSIGDDALYGNAMKAARKWANAEHHNAKNLGAGGPGKEDDVDRAEEAFRTALDAMFDSRAPAAQASATIQAPPKFTVEVRGNQTFIVSGSDSFRLAYEAENEATANWYAGRLREAVTPAATIQEPVMVAEPVRDIRVLRRWATQIDRMASTFIDERSLLCQQAAILLYRIAYLPDAAPMVADPAGVVVPDLSKLARFKATSGYYDRTVALENHSAGDLVKFADIAALAATVKAVPSEARELAGMVVKATFGDHKILVPRVDLSGKGIGTLVYFAAPLAGKTGGGE